MYARPAYTPAPAPAPVYSWTGIYWGGNVGYSWGQSKNDNTASIIGLGVSAGIPKRRRRHWRRPNRLQLSVWNMGIRVGNRHSGLRSESRLGVSGPGTSCHRVDH